VKVVSGHELTSTRDCSALGCANAADGPDGRCRFCRAAAARARPPAIPPFRDSLGLLFDPELELVDWTALVRRIARLQSSINWWLGDAIVHSELPADVKRGVVCRELGLDLRSVYKLEREEEENIDPHDPLVSASASTAVGGGSPAHGGGRGSPTPLSDAAAPAATPARTGSGKRDRRTTRASSPPSSTATERRTYRAERFREPRTSLRTLRAEIRRAAAWRTDEHEGLGARQRAVAQGR
jgi:hypothetical protein